MEKRFAVIGSGWRAEFYIRIALHPGNDFRLTGLLCRTPEKAAALHEKYGITPTLSQQEILDGKPDFVVVAVSKPDIASVSAHWRGLGIPVLCETPAAVTLEELERIWADRAGAPLMVAEQYEYYPTYRKMLDLIGSGRLGEPVSAVVSLAHDYHGASLLRQALGEPCGRPYRLMAKRYELPVVKTGDRTHIYREGEIWKRFRTVANVEFADGKAAVYDFDGEQYHSSIRHNSIRVTGTRGELMNERLWYLNEENDPVEERWTEDIQQVRAAAKPGELSQDESAILTLMEQLWRVSRGEDREIWLRNLRNALSDAYFMLLLQQSDGAWLDSRSLPWMEDV